MPKRYDPQEAEPRLQKYWEEKQVYRFGRGDTTKPIYSIDTPPPTVSGKMHMGHAFGNSQQDFIARYKRMRGFNVLQPFGTDDNGLPTKLLIEKTKKVRASHMDRKEFRKLCLETLENELKPRYTQDWKRLGISCDFTVSYSTIDPHCQRISQTSFLDLLEQGREYRTEAPAMYCPKCQTAISQVETRDEDIQSHFNDLVFKTQDTEGNEKELIIATTRPELLPACVAVFYHPSDERYQKLEGKEASVPFFDFTVPIIADERADPEKGTGLVMCCTFGDQTDMEWQKAYQLPIKIAIGKDGRMTDLAGDYKGMKIEEARKQIIEDMKEKGLLRNQEEITHTVNVHERCDTPIEYIHSKQWFIKYLDLKDEMLEWGNELNWKPSHMKNRYDNWVKGLQWDWCISRQLPFGIPFPVWYCASCEEVIPAHVEDLPVDPMVDTPPVKQCPSCGATEFEPEQDIINTWATSSLTPTIVKELMHDTPVYPELVKRPFNLRPQGHDIISFWLFNTVVKSKLHFKMKPWQDCFINGWMLDPKGKKMSKSKGNVIEPQDMIEKYSSDALRYMASGTKLGEDQPFQEKDLVTGKKFVTKLWNASRFALMHLEHYDTQTVPETFAPADRWVLGKLNRVIMNATTALDNYDFSRAKADIELFFWQDFCDNYLEIVKPRLYNEALHETDAYRSAQYTLYTCLYSILQLMAPFTPFIVEEIYQHFFKAYEQKESVHNTEWPTADDALIDPKMIEAGDLAISYIGAVRKAKSEKNVSLKTPVTLLQLPVDAEEMLDQFRSDIKATTNAQRIIYGEEFSIDF